MQTETKPVNRIPDKSARDKIIRARTNLLVSNGFFGTLAMYLKLVEAYKEDGVETMAVDGVHLYYNAEFTHSLNERECEGVVAHEVMHCAFQHFSRRGPRDPMKWNIAGDFVINLDITEAGFVLPGTAITLDMGMNPSKGEVKGHLLDPQFKGMSTEDVYERLPKIKVKFYSIGDVKDSPGDASKKEGIKDGWEIAVRTAIHVARAQNAGNLPGSLKRLIGELDKPKISWRDKTRSFIDQSMTKDISWARINRRSLSIGTLMPGLISDRLNHLVFVVDDSGSINMKLLTEFLSEVSGALDEGVADQMTVVYADTRVHHVDHFVPGDLVVPHELPNGGGGTAFSNSFKWIKDNVPEASCIIYLTDLRVNDFGEEPECPCLWAVYAPDSIYDQLAAAAPFGTPLQVSNELG